MKYVAFVLMVLTVMAVSADVNPGLRTTVSQAGIDYVKDVMMPKLIDEVLTLQIPDMNETAHSIIGKIQITLSNFNLTEFNITDSDIVFQTPNIVNVTLTGASFHLTLNWHYHSHIASDKGHADAHTDGASARISAKIEKDANGAPVVTLLDPLFVIGDFNFKLHGGASWLYNLILKHFKGKIRNAITEALNTKVPEVVQNLVTQALSTVPLTYDFKNGMSICYALADQPSIITENGNRLVAGSVAESYVTKEGRGKSPYKPTAMPKTTSTSNPGPMVEVLINEYGLNTAAYAFVHSNNTHMKIDEKNAPVEAKPLLISGYYSTAAPGLIEKYGLDAQLRLDFDVKKDPTLYMQPDGFQLQTTALLTMEVNVSNTFVEAMELNLAVTTAGVVSLNGTSIIGTLTNLKISATVASSQVGTIDVDGLQQLIDFTATFATATINERLAEGFPLPMVKGFTFVDPKIIWGSSYVAVASSFTYEP